MPVHRCSRSSLCLHELGGVEADEAGDFEYVEIDPSGRYGRYKEVLGRGAFKTVYRAFDQEDGIEVAWNQVQDVLLCTQEDLDRLYSEVHLLSQLKHKNIMKLYHSWVDKKAHTLNFITEIFTSGTLRQYRKRHKHIDIKAVKNWSRQIVRGLLYLHSHDPPIIHRDLKCDNIFINGNHGEVKIGDLGLAAILEHAHACSVIGTPEFMAPELYEEEYTELVDIYSFGMCLLEMVTSQYPYSECSNAAQIYRKVMLGKRPEAMKLVKDRELCQFIEKCLAPASKRLPARELLMDPFLRCEASQSALESSPFVGRMRRAIGMDDAEVINDDAHAISATVQISYVMKETLPAFVYDGSESCGCLAGDSKGAQIGELKVPQAVELVPSHLKEDRGRSVDFRVNGKRREDNNVFLKLQISGSEGQVRNIHFPFDVQCDTALCVASEMVAELDLTDQDVTKIAEMIDAAIMALVPEWKPGVAIDETCCEGETLDIEGCDHSVNEFDPVSLSQGLLEDMIPPLMAETLSPTKVEGLVYSRFEEVTYQCHRSEFPAVEVEQCTEICTVTSTASDSTKEADWSLSDTSSHISQTQVSTHEDVIPVSEQLTQMDSKESKEDINVGTAFNELVELNRKSGCANFVHKLLEGLAHGHSCCEMDTTLAPAHLLEENNECDDPDETELAELVKRHEQEKLELQRKHDEALAEVRRRWQRKMICENRDDGCYPSEGKFLGKPHMSLKTHGSSLEMQGNIHCELVSLNGSMTSLEDFSSVGQETPKSLSTFVGSWQEVKL